MRLKRLEISDWRRFRDGPYEIMFDPRSTVLAGPNEAGKSTLFEAIRRALFDRAQSTAQWVQRILPYEIHGAIPRALLEFEHGGHTWRIEKAFGGARGTAALSARRDERWITIARGKDADDQLRALLGATFSTSPGGTRPGDWGAFQWLFVPQDVRELPQSEAVGYLGLTQAGVSDKFNAVLERVNAAYRDTFTPTGLVAKRSLRHEIEEELIRLQKEKEEIEATLKSLDEMRRRYGEIEEELPVLEEEVTRAETEWNKTIDEHVDLSGTEGELNAAQARYDQRKAERDTAIRIVHERLTLEQAVKSVASALEEKNGQRAAKAAELARIGAELDQARKDVQNRETEVVDARRILQDARDLHDIRDKKAKREGLIKRRAQIHEIEGSIEKLRSKLAGETPSAALIEKITELSAQAQAERAALESSGLQVSVDGDPAVTVLLDGTPLRNKAGVALESVLITAPGGSVRIAGDTTRAKRHADAAKEIQIQIKRMLSQFAVSSLAELRRLRENRLQREGKLTALNRERNNLDPRPLSAIDAEIAALNREINQLERARENHGSISAHDELSDAQLSLVITRLTQKIIATEQELDEAKDRRDALYRQLEGAQGAMQEAESAYQAAKARKQAAEEALDRHRDRYGSTGNCRERMKAAKEALMRVTKERGSAQARLDALKQDIESRRTAAKNRYDHVRDRLEQRKATADELARQLEQASDKGYYARAASLERQIVSEEGRLARIVQHSDAAKLLKKTMGEVRSSLTQRIIAPIKDDLDMRLAVATSGRYRLATLGDALVPQRLEGDERCEFADGSQGLQELVNTLVRMSVAAHLAAHEPQVLILDDPCVHVSRERTARVVELLNQLTDTGRVQAVILTHRELEFAGLEGSFVEVEDIVHGQ